MHPDNNPLDLANGQLYVKDPETGDTAPCEIKLGSGDTLAEFTVPTITGAELHDKAAEYLRQMNLPEVTLELDPTPEFNIWLQNLVETYKAWLQQIVIEQEQACIKWAKENRRKWLHIGRTTKKARTRKKYAKLIWRDYKAARAAALARIAGED